jgi:hypothetical protein
MCASVTKKYVVCARGRVGPFFQFRFEQMIYCNGVLNWMGFFNNFPSTIVRLSNDNSSDCNESLKCARGAKNGNITRPLQMCIVFLFLEQEYESANLVMGNLLGTFFRLRPQIDYFPAESGCCPVCLIQLLISFNFCFFSVGDCEAAVGHRGPGPPVPVAGAPAAGGHGRREGKAGHNVRTQLGHRGK